VISRGETLEIRRAERRGRGNEKWAFVGGTVGNSFSRGEKSAHLRGDGSERRRDRSLGELLREVSGPRCKDDEETEHRNLGRR